MTLSKAIICNLDGTLCDNRHRLHFVDPSRNPLAMKWGNTWIHKEIFEKYNCCSNWSPNYESFYAAMGEDDVNEPIRNLINKYAHHSYEVLFITGRPEKYKEITKKWLFEISFADNFFLTDKLFMRPDFLPCDIPGWRPGHLLKPSEWDDRCFVDIDGSAKSRKPDHCPSHEVKREIYEREIKGKYEVLFVLEDSERCCETYKELGLQVLKVM